MVTGVGPPPPLGIPLRERMAAVKKDLARGQVRERTGSRMKNGGLAGTRPAD
jgi:hypothetical protein